MKLLRYAHGTTAAGLGALSGNSVIPIDRLVDSAGDMASLIANWHTLEPQARALMAQATESIALDELELLAPIARPGKIFAIGLNYADHIEESKMGTPEQQVWFTKAVTSVNAPFGDVEIPTMPSFVDYEVEMVAVIGKGGRNIDPADARDAVFGYCVGNDMTERMWQHRVPQWSLGKSFDTHAPIGPWITTSDEVADPHTLDIKCWVGNELRQDSNTCHLVFNLWDQIAHLSCAMTLEPGDLIFTGTPGGIGAAMDPRKFLQPGEIVRSTIGELGEIRNTMALRQD